MRKVLADGQGRGGEHPSTGPRFDIAAQSIRDFKGRELQRQSIRRRFDPAQAGLFGHRTQGAQGPSQTHRPPGAVGNARAGSQSLEFATQVAESGLKLRQHIHERFWQIRPLVPASPTRNAAPQVIEMRLHDGKLCGNRRRPHGRYVEFCDHIAQ